jgi:hypothetical protein
MRAWEFLTEAQLHPEEASLPTKPTDKLLPDQAGALPATYIIPELPNQDPYLQYRFGVALAGAKGRKQREQDGVSSMDRTSAFGEAEIIVSYGDDVGPFIDDALKQMGMSGKKMVSTPTSIETSDVTKVSPMRPFKGYAR